MHVVNSFEPPRTTLLAYRAFNGDRGISSSPGHLNFRATRTRLDAMAKVASGVPASWRTRWAGLVLREYVQDRPTGRSLRWHPGGGHHGPEPYWRVTSPELGRSEVIR